MSSKHRHTSIDFFRGLGTGFIVVYHLLWDLYSLGVVNPPHTEEEVAPPGVPTTNALLFSVYVAINFAVMRAVKWRLGEAAQIAYFTVATVICLRLWRTTSQEAGVGLLMMLVGWSSGITHNRKFDWNFVRIRLWRLGALSLLVSVASYVFAPESWIYFGALHCIWLNSLLHLPFIHTSLEVVLAAAVCIFTYTPLFGKFPLEVPTKQTLDFIPWFHNLGFVLLGLLAAKFQLHWQLDRNFDSNEIFCRIGRHALPVYLGHQLVLFPLAYSLSLFTK